jgi:XTP/dITP diphosphohydrolase
MKLKKNSVLVIASHNKGKIPEIKKLLSEFQLEIKGAGEYDLSEPEENGQTFADNALLKTRAATSATGLASISDDSGLCVEALDGNPGIYSARWNGDTKDFRIGMARIEKELREKNATDFSAKFVCALALCAPDGQAEVFVGEVYGSLIFPARGAKGNGYDPIFIAKGMHQTFGEIAPEQKDEINHRAQAFKKLKEALQVE